ncbi:putative lipoprotein LprP [Dissostichus eleginoides]|uniref:Lipoprotein LprP n=1 Tax=Dissostichus eleginoides TaxID=100907 RepID=A0AAD9BCP2_DISEL|nr:putative lipoprotein LprP [Dissostichus eleginoides]
MALYSFLGSLQAGNNAQQSPLVWKAAAGYNNCSMAGPLVVSPLFQKSGFSLPLDRDQLVGAERASLIRDALRCACMVTGGNRAAQPASPPRGICLCFLAAKFLSGGAPKRNCRVLSAVSYALSPGVAGVFCAQYLVVLCSNT